MLHRKFKASLDKLTSRLRGKKNNRKEGRKLKRGFRGAFVIPLKGDTDRDQTSEGVRYYENF